MKTVTRQRTKVTLATLKKGGAMEQVRRSLKEIEGDIKGVDVEIFDLTVDLLRKKARFIKEGFAHPSLSTPAKRWAWAERISGSSRKQIDKWFFLLQGEGKSAKTLDEAVGRDQRGYHADRDERIRDEQWDEIFERAKKNVDAASRETLADLGEDRGEEKRQADLAERLINTGYKALATTMHPDKGGSQEGMARLNMVKHLLLEVVEEIRG